MDVTWMHTIFGGRDLSSFRDIVTLKTANFPFRKMGYNPWSSKNLIDRNRLKKFMQIGMDVTCMHTNFGGRDLSSFRDIVTLKNSQFPFRKMGYNPWSSKNLIDRNRLKKFMQIGMDVTCMHTNFGGRDLSSFRDIVTLKNSQFSLSEDGL